MKCSICDGDGVITFNKIDKNGHFNDAFFMKECFVCYGTGEVQTNEEWFCGLSTEEKIKVLLNLHEKVRQRMRAEIGGENSFYKGDYYREWLKEKHEGNMG